MPNWSTNRITLYEDYDLEGKDFYNDKDGNYNIKEIFEQFLKDTEEEVEQDGEKITFHNLMNVMPTPEILRKVHASNPPYIYKDKKTGEYVWQDFFEEVDESTTEKIEIVKGTDIYDELMEKFGCLTWYDWNVDAWGTKWSARMDDIDLDEYRLQFWCDTAWCPPNELLEFIADKYKVTVECFYEIEGYGDEGVGKDTYSPNLEEAKI